MLIEVLATVTLSALLMFGLMGVIGSIGRSGALASTNKLQRQSQRLENAAEQIAEDLQHARKLRLEHDRVACLGYRCVDPATGAVDQRPAQIVYEIRRIAERSWLIRRQTRLDVLTNLNTSTELVCEGVSEFGLGGYDGDPGWTRFRTTTTSWIDPPERMTVYIKPVETDQPTYRRRIIMGTYRLEQRQ